MTKNDTETFISIANDIAEGRKTVALRRVRAFYSEFGPKSHRRNLRTIQCRLNVLKPGLYDDELEIKLIQAGNLGIEEHVERLEVEEAKLKAKAENGAKKKKGPDADEAAI